MNEVHTEVCNRHQSGSKLQYQAKRLGYYWPTMVVYCIEYTKRCHVCQLDSDYGHVPVNHCTPPLTYGHFPNGG